MAEAERLGRPQLGPIHIASTMHGPAPGTQRWKRTLAIWLLVLAALVVAGAFLVLSTVNYYFGVYKTDIIDPSQVAYYLDVIKSSPAPTATPRVPRIIHQTWINETLPAKWVPVRETCELLHPSSGPAQTWEYMLWTDESSRAFIEKEYNWFLPHFDGYQYPIQRADVIRYFVLHHYGGVYMDLDIGCEKPMDPLLFFDVILPITIPVGVSNDLMLSTPKHPFMDLVIHQLIMFDHHYGTNYPTVMFSTGPMMLSAVYGMWKRDHTKDPLLSNSVRILPQILYGKNAPVELQAYSLFTHYYGSSWHSDDSGIIMWLGRSGKLLLYVLAVVAVVGLVREVFIRRTRVGGKWKRAAAGVISPRLGSCANGGMGLNGPAVANLPFTLEGWAHTSAEVGGRIRRLKRGDLFFLPAYWMGESSRPGSPSLSGSPVPLPSSSSYWSWATYFPTKISGGSGGKYRPLRKASWELEIEGAVSLEALSSKRAHRRGWNSSSHSSSEVDDDVVVGSTRDGSIDDDEDRTPLGVMNHYVDDPLPSYTPFTSTQTPMSPLGKAFHKLGQVTGLHQSNSSIRLTNEEDVAELGYATSHPATPKKNDRSPLPLARTRPTLTRNSDCLSSSRSRGLEDETGAFLASIEAEDEQVKQLTSSQNST